MATSTSRSPAVKRLMKELAELRASPSAEFTAEPLEDNLLEWHFTLRGPPDGGFLGGRYHGRLIFPTDYPFKPPNISFLTLNGRFEVGKKICLSITGYHPESWRPAWGVRTALVALISFFPTKGEGAVGALDWSEEERRKCAVRSKLWKCVICGATMHDVLPDESLAPTERLEVDPEISLTVRADAPAVTESAATNESANINDGAPSDKSVCAITTTTEDNTAVAAGTSAVPNVAEAALVDDAPHLANSDPISSQKPHSVAAVVALSVDVSKESSLTSTAPQTQPWPTNPSDSAVAPVSVPVSAPESVPASASASAEEGVVEAVAASNHLAPSATKGILHSRISEQDQRHNQVQQSIRTEKQTTLMQRLDFIIMAVVGIAAALVLHKVFVAR
ncbi:hypothetical protein BASA50_003420 [Batrachochytrium salamandrivorans]|uniref:UBC core domain-containing protein n=1 Tax=Batrachochytrium salamandrivorans TaxID=1357716 RepID=A0ABQ8FIN1_9FUNG|nr:hypothetical protein BASA62_003750 [Batrachochytrium salamandrivorans]KAH6581175.1 hypothetical protein BASA60_002558 [Batrachochytrium salamandrivorans]KAH6598402.1 hypothetical protein BASA61_002872 [Batrachochytrium salamandrivorans]KAH6598914.1 hypothetical protein BASA50_003420 [Batrachochytrium salamandrivorans]KAH9273651.1 hypothetical protein BASA83_003983 [Batrachochytrium salamandrivorans]